jgi:hypothetical protein
MLKRLAVLSISFAIPGCLDATEPPPAPPESGAPSLSSVSSGHSAEGLATASGARIESLAWTWHGCGPSASPLPFSLTVDVVVSSSLTSYKIKGDAVDCDPFDASGELEPCMATPFAALRTLTVSATDGHGSDTRTTAVQDCVDGKVTY